MAQKREIEGTTVFDGEQAAKGYQLNKMCFSFNDPENRKKFLADQGAYIDKYKLTPEQRAALATGSVLKMIEAGGNAYYLAKLAGILGLGVQDIGAQQTGMSVEAFKQKLLDAGRQ
ncbi:MAG: protocatechuate 4,5-dioxygenase subunit alpha [Bradyrhizobium sp.]|nr:protocatechuate 4,5-dioxygenase subunit alpha [Bradyrhizobium sp.]